MVDREQLLGLTDREVYASAVRHGVERAVKSQDMGSNPNALKEWAEENPEFTDPEVEQKMLRGSQEMLDDVLEMLSKESNADGLYNFDGQGGRFYPLDPK